MHTATQFHSPFQHKEQRHEYPPLPHKLVYHHTAILVSGLKQEETHYKATSPYDKAYSFP